MKKLFFLLLFLLTFIAYSEERDLYIGDTIKLKVESLSIEEEELREKFKDFEIEKVERDEEFYIVSFTSYNPGDYNIKIANNNINIKVKSLLDPNKDQEIKEFESEKSRNFLQLREDGFIYKAILSVLLILALLIVLVYYLIKILRREKNDTIDEKKEIIESIELVDSDIDEIIKRFKRYLSLIYKKKVESYTGRELREFLSEKENSEKLLEKFELVDEKRYSNTNIDKDSIKELKSEILDFIFELNKKEESDV